jgi:hypothetical protein
MACIGIILMMLTYECIQTNRPPFKLFPTSIVYYTSECKSEANAVNNPSHEVNI